MYIVMDLEFNCTNNSYVSEKNGVRLPNEIIEIGAVKLDDDLNEMDRVCSFIKPETSHDALNDALNTAEVLRQLDLTEGLDEYEV